MSGENFRLPLGRGVALYGEKQRLSLEIEAIFMSNHFSAQNIYQTMENINVGEV